MKVLRIVLMITLPLLVLGGGAWAAWTLVLSRPEPKKEAPVFEPPLVEAMTVEPKAIRLTVLAEGVVAPRTESELVPEVAGRVMEVSSALVAGGFFEKDDVLLEIDPREYELAVIRSRAAVAQAKLRVATEEQEAAVARKEWASLGEGEPAPLAVREPQLAEASAALASAQAALEQAEFDLARTIVRAPYAGRIRSKRVDVGQFVQRGASVATLYAVDIAEVRLPIPDEELAYVSVPLAYRDVDHGESAGPSVILRADFAGRTHEWSGQIVRTEGEIDARTRMVQVIAQVRDPYAQGGRSGRPPLAVGMFVEAEIQGRAVRAVEIPRTAMRNENTVMVINNEDRVEFRELQILRRERDRVLVQSGLEPGERVCISTLEAAVEGMPVRVLETASEEKGAATGQDQRL